MMWSSSLPFLSPPSQVSLAGAFNILNGALRYPAPLRNRWNQVKAGHPALANVHFADTVDDRFDIIADFGGAGPRVGGSVPAFCCWGGEG